MNEPDVNFLDRDIQLKAKPILDRINRLFEKCVNYGTHLNATLNRSSSGKDVAPAILLGLHALEILDAIGVLLATCCADPAKAMLRVQMEALFNIEFMAIPDSELKSKQYLVSHAHARIDWYEKLDPTTDAGKQLNAYLRKDSEIPNIDIVSRNTQAEIDNLRKLLARPEYRKVEEEWQRTKQLNKAKPSWYSLFGGPRNVEALSKVLNQHALYQILYRLYSAEIHGTNAMESLHTSTDGQPTFQPLRYPISTPNTAYLTITLSLMTFRALISMLDPRLMQSFEEWYQLEIKADYADLRKLRIKDVDRNTRVLNRRDPP